MKTLFAHGKPVADDASRVCVLFDPKDGRVVHIHGLTTLHGRETISDAELEKRTADHAMAFGHSVAGLKTLHVPISSIRNRGIFKVNATGTGLEVTRQPKMRPGELLTRWRKENIHKTG